MFLPTHPQTVYSVWFPFIRLTTWCAVASVIVWKGVLEIVSHVDFPVVHDVGRNDSIDLELEVEKTTWSTHQLPGAQPGSGPVDWEGSALDCKRSNMHPCSGQLVVKRPRAYVCNCCFMYE